MFGSSNTFDPNKDIPSLEGKVYVVTGGSAGIGLGICAHILQHNPSALYLLGKKESHIAEATERLKEYGDTSKLHTVQIELEDLHNVAQVSSELASSLSRLDALILNAGLGVGPYSTTINGIDSHMQVNVLSQHHILMTLLPLLRSTPSSRLVLQSSDLHRFAPSSTSFSSFEEINKDIGTMYLYNRTKFAQVLQVLTLYRRKQAGEFGLEAGQPPYVIATHPGGVVTDQQDQAVEAYGTLGKIGVAAARKVMKDPIDEGCRPALFAATSEDVIKEGLDGVYIVPDRKVTDVTKQAKDEELQERLWKLVETTLEEKLGKLGYETTYGPSGWKRVDCGANKSSVKMKSGAALQ